MDMKFYKKDARKVRIVREPGIIKSAKMSSSRSSAEYARQIYEMEGDSITLYESFYMLSLNNANNVTDYSLISKGGITGTLVDIRILAKLALDTLAVSVILIHNHPSGTLRPSQADINLTKKIKNGLELLDIKVLDHIIITENKYFSFADEGMI